MKITTLVNSAAYITVMFSPAASAGVLPVQLTKQYIRTIDSETSSQSISCKILSNFVYTNEFSNLYTKCKDVLPEQRYFSKEEKNSYQKSLNTIFKKTGKKLSW